jgi:hypothetical protein
MQIPETDQSPIQPCTGIKSSAEKHRFYSSFFACENKFSQTVKCYLLSFKKKLNMFAAESILEPGEEEEKFSSFGRPNRRGWINSVITY